jgi:pimeloyl-ACP methyl ester carboxylesterase
MKRNLISTPPRRGAAWAAAALAAGAATAAWVHHRATQAERQHPPSGRLLDVDGVRLHCVERGAGPPLLLLHGNLASLLDFEASGLIDRLARSHRVIAFDRPGYGHSTRPRSRVWTPSAQARLYFAALEQLGAERPKVLGHSMGTLPAIAMALERPNAVRSLVLLAGYYYPSARIDALLTAPVAWPVVGDVLRYTVTNLAGRLLLDAEVKGMFAPLDVPPGYIETLSREMTVRPSALRANAEDAACMLPAVHAAEPGYRHLAMPVSLIAGADDLVVNTEKHSVRLHRELAQSALHVLPGVGHMVHHAALERVADAVELAI